MRLPFCQRAECQQGSHQHTAVSCGEELHQGLDMVYSTLLEPQLYEEKIKKNV